MFFSIHVFLLYICLKINRGFYVRSYDDLIRFYNDIIVIIKFPAAAGLLLLTIPFI